MKNPKTTNNQKRAQQDKMWERIFNAVPDLIMILDTQHEILRTNKAMAKRLGKTPEELVGLRCYEIVHGTKNPPDFCPHSCLLKDGKEHSVDTHEVRLGGDFLISVSPFYDSDQKIMGSVHIARDITELKKSERALQESEKKFRNLADQSPNMIFINTKGRIVYVNKKCEEITGYSKKEFYAPDFDFRKLIAPGSQKIISDTFKMHMTGEDVEPYEYELITKDGRYLSVINAPKLIMYEGENSILGVVTDITDRVQMEQQLKYAHDDLEKKVHLRTKELWVANQKLLKEIEERKQAEHDLIGAELRYRTVADFTYDWEYWIGSDGKMLYVSPSSERITGFKAENYIKDPTLLKKIIIKEDQKLWDKQHTGQKKDEPHELQFRIRTKLGDERWIEHVCQPVTDEKERFLGYRASNRDITHRKKIEEELESKKQSLAEAQRIAHLGNWDWNIVANELYWSDEIYRIFGLTPQEFGATYEAFLESVHPDDRPLVERSVDAALQEDKPYSIDHRIVLRDGSVRIVHEQAEVMRDETGQAIRMAGTVHDITERKNVEEDRRQLREELTHVSRVTTVGTLAGALAHEINQPLTAIMSNAQAAKRFLEAEEPNTDELREILSDIVDDTARSSDIIQQLRYFMKKGEIEAVPLNINTTIQEVINLTQRDAEHRKMAIKLDMNENLPDVMGDKIQLQQVILNLVINGFDAMMSQEPGSRELVIRTEQDEGDNIHVAVSDTGIGIEEQNLEQIFEPFVSTKPEGMGLGLSINRYIISAHNGHMWAANNPDQGATFHFTLPVKK